MPALNKKVQITGAESLAPVSASQLTSTFERCITSGMSSQKTWRDDRWPSRLLQRSSIWNSAANIHKYTACAKLYGLCSHKLET